MIELAIIIALALFIAVLMFDYVKLRLSLSKYNTIYIDTGGVKKSPPDFIDTMQGKTLNIKINKKHSVTIQHFGFFENLFYVDRLYVLYNSMVNFMDEISGLDIDDKTRKKKQVIIYRVYSEIGKLIYNISKKWGKRGYKNAFFKKFYSDTDWVYSLSEELIKYWLLVKKKISFLPGGIEFPQTLGDPQFFRSLSVDSTGKASIKPRCDIFLN